MLRLNLSRIQLEKKDLDFHKETHRRRQAAHVHSPSAAYNTESCGKSHGQIKNSKSTLSQSPRKKAYASHVKVLACEQNPEDALISQDPIPRGSRAFWDKILAEAGTPTRTRSTGSGTGRVVDPSDDWLDDNRSTRASIEAGPDLDNDPRDGHTSSEDTRDLALTPRNPSSSESFHSTHISNVDGKMIERGMRASMESTQQPSSRRRLSNFFWRKSKVVADVGKMQLHATMDLGLDGHHSDMHRYHDQDKSTSTETSQGESLGDGLYGSRHDRRKISTSFDKSVIHDSTRTQNPVTEPIQQIQPESRPAILPMLVDSLQHPSGTLPRSPLYISQAAASSSPENPLIVSPIPDSPSLLSLPPRRRRTYRPRSETYSFEISEASSSTAAHVEVRPVRPAELSMPRPLNSPGNPHLASIQAGSPLSPSSIVHVEQPLPSKNYLSSSSPINAFSLGHSRLNSSSSSPIVLPGNPFNLSHSRLTSRSSSHIQYPQTSPHDGTWTDHPPPHGIDASGGSVHVHSDGSSAMARISGQTPVQVENFRSVSHSTNFSNTRSPSVSSYRNLSPYALPFIPRSTRSRNLTPQYPLPPPFGATPRTVSDNRTLPISISPIAPSRFSPIPPLTPPPHQYSVSGSVPSTPPRNSFTIYNDSQPPHIQPQTPADLHRRPPRNSFYTAPARSDRSLLPPPAVNLAVAGWQTYATPTRARETPTRFRSRESPLRMEEMVSPGAENTDAVSWEERERRRLWNEGVRIGREEQRRLERSLRLLRRPGA